jgi:glycosyltransferase involved in cell wall biosynthesis
MTTISIVIPNLNGSTYLRQTLESLSKQKCQPDEIIFSDNHSTDGSIEILREFPSLEIKAVIPPRQLSMSENWNYVVRASTSSWFVLLSNDDLLRDTAVCRLKKDISDLKVPVGIISYRAEFIDEESNLILGKYPIGRNRYTDGVDFIKENLKSTKINIAATAVNKEIFLLVGGYPEEYKYIHDMVFYQRVSLVSKLLLSKQVLGQYRIYRKLDRGDSIRKQKTNLDFQIFESTDLLQILEKYPHLDNYYSDSLRENRDNRTINYFAFARSFVLKCFTFCRRIEVSLKISGFPSSKL